MSAPEDFGIDTEYRHIALHALAEEIDRLACRREDVDSRALLVKLGKLARDVAEGFPE